MAQMTPMEYERGSLNELRGLKQSLHTIPPSAFICAICVICGKNPARLRAAFIGVICDICGKRIRGACDPDPASLRAAFIPLRRDRSCVICDICGKP